MVDVLVDQRLVATFLRETSVELLHATLKAGKRWEGCGWNTTRAALALQDLTGASLVSSQLTSYLNAFLFSMDSVRDLEISQLDVTA